MIDIHRMRVPLLVVGVAIVGVTAVVTAGHAGNLDAVPQGEVKQALEENAGRLAADNGGKIPQRAEVVLTTRQASQKAVSGGAEVSTDQPVYLVQMEGTFTASAAPIPAGVDPPTGGSLWFLFDPATGETADWGIGTATVDIGVLGQVSEIEPSNVNASTSTSTPQGK